MIHYGNLRIKTLAGVYEPAEDSFLLAGSLYVAPGSSVLDMGTGTGLLALVAAEKAGHVLGVDVNPAAVRLAWENASLNRIMNVEFRVSDLFGQVDGYFDLIIFNPPYLPVNETDPLGRAWSGGREGLDVIRRFISSAPQHLTDKGIIMLLVSSLNDVKVVEKLLEGCGLGYDVAASKRFFFEELYAIRCYTSVI